MSSIDSNSAGPVQDLPVPTESSSLHESETPKPSNDELSLSVDKNEEKVKEEKIDNNPRNPIAELEKSLLESNSNIETVKSESDVNTDRMEEVNLLMGLQDGIESTSEVIPGTSTTNEEKQEGKVYVYSNHEESSGGDVNCVCGVNDDSGGDDWIQCEHCSNWLHMKCVGIDENRIPSHYFCPSCLPQVVNCPCNQPLSNYRLVHCSSCKMWQHAKCVGFKGPQKGRRLNWKCPLCDPDSFTPIESAQPTEEEKKLSREERKMQDIMNQFQQMEEREENAKRRAAGLPPIDKFSQKPYPNKKRKPELFEKFAKKSKPNSYDNVRKPLFSSNKIKVRDGKPSSVAAAVASRMSAKAGRSSNLIKGMYGRSNPTSVNPSRAASPNNSSSEEISPLKYDDNSSSMYETKLELSPKVEVPHSRLNFTTFVIPALSEINGFSMKEMLSRHSGLSKSLAEFTKQFQYNSNKTFSKIHDRVEMPKKEKILVSKSLPSNTPSKPSSSKFSFSEYRSKVAAKSQ